MSVQFSKGIPEKGYSKPEIWDQRPGTPGWTKNPGPKITWRNIGSSMTEVGSGS